MGDRMKSRLASRAVPAFLSALLLTLAAGGISTAAEQPRSSRTVSSNVSLVPVVGAAKDQILRSLAANRGAASTMSPAHHECPGGTPHVQGLACPSTTSDELTQAGSCVIEDGSSRILLFEGKAGSR